MAEKKDFIIENYNGTDYDTLYPQTNSGQVLLDTDAQTNTHLPSGSTLDDALQSVTKGGGAFQIGDTLTTARTDLGDDWLLCNGQQILSSNYPALTSLIGTSMFNWVKNGTTTQTNIYKVVDSGKNEDLFYAVYKTVSPSRTYLIKSTDLITWSNVTFYTQTGLDVFCANETIICNNQYIKNATPTTIADMENFVTGATYWNGKYYLATQNPDLEEDDDSIYIYTDLDVAPVKINLNANRTKYISATPIGVVAPQGITTTGGSSTLGIYVVDSANKVNYYSINLPKNYNTYPIIEYFNGYYYLALTTSSGTHPHGPGDIYRSTSISGPYSPVKTEDLVQVTTTFLTVTNDYLITNNGYYISTDNVVRKQDSSITGNLPVLIGKDNYYLMNGTDSYKSLIETSATLPTASVASGLYTYIKAKN